MRGIRSLLYQFSLLPLAVQYKHGRYERVKSRSEATLDSFVSRPELIECIYRPKLLNFFRPLLFILFLDCSIFSAFFAYFLLTTTILFLMSGYLYAVLGVKQMQFRISKSHMGFSVSYGKLKEAGNLPASFFGNLR